jgi:hemerythrin-like domain-containing protein
MKDKTKNGMLPIGPLMKEHRLIERMVALLKRQKETDLCFIGKAVDFFRVYADRCHHGKEEDILFKALTEKPLSPQHKEIMAGLLRDHVRARELVGQLDKARARSLQRDPSAAGDIKGCVKAIVELYAAHIQKEDKQFFIPAMGYFTSQELDGMLRQFYEFDRTLIHEKYRMLVEKIKK